MDKIDLMIKRRALFLTNVIALYNGIMDDAESFGMLLNGFSESYMEEYFDLFSLIYVFEKNEDGKLQIHEVDEWAISLYKYLNYFTIGDNKNIIKLYDDVGQEDVDKITCLVELFIDYINLLYQDNYELRLKS